MSDYQICPECQHQNRPEAKFCDNCGAKTISQTQVETPSMESKQYSNPPLKDGGQYSATYEMRLWWSKLPLQAKYAIAGGAGFVIILLLIALVVSNETPKSNYQGLAERNSPSSSSPSVPSSPDPESVASSNLNEAKSLLRNPVMKKDLEGAISYLNRIPSTSLYYKEAIDILKQIKAGKVNALPEIPGFEDESADIYSLAAEVNKSITYGHLKKNADKYYGEAWAFTGKVLEIYESGGRTGGRVGIGSYGLDAIWVEGAFATDFVEGDRVFVIGKLRGTKTYESQAGWTITIPQIEAIAMIKPGASGPIVSQFGRGR